MDSSAFEGFYRERLPTVVRACTLVTADPALSEEIAAEAFARLWANWGRIHDEDHAGGYVYKTAMRMCMKRALRVQRESPVSDAGRVVDDVGTTTERAHIFAQLAELPTRQRQAVVLRDWAGFEVDEIAAILRIRDSTVRVHLARGRRTLRERLSMD
jgi:RNA polymerase sigma-70 factor (ECF subfamily)